ncbi:hypothetical protein JEZ13_07755 [bacterium]|nr:hypothetical protein [bacterium]
MEIALAIILIVIILGVIISIGAKAKTKENKNTPNIKITFEDNTLKSEDWDYSEIGHQLKRLYNDISYLSTCSYLDTSIMTVREILESIDGIKTHIKDPSMLEVYRKIGIELLDAKKKKEIDKQKTISIRDSIHCPHCNFEFDKTPGRKRKCPSCGNDIFRYNDQDKIYLVLANEHDHFTDKNVRQPSEQELKIISDFKILYPEYKDYFLKEDEKLEKMLNNE